MLTYDDIYVGKAVEFLSSNNDIGVIVRINAKSVKIAFGHSTSNFDISNFDHAKTKNISDIEVIPTDDLKIGTYGYVRLNSELEFTKENLESKNLIRAVILANSNVVCKLAIFENELLGGATKIIEIKPSKLDDFFSTRIN